MKQLGKCTSLEMYFGTECNIIIIVKGNVFMYIIKMALFGEKYS